MKQLIIAVLLLTACRTEEVAAPLDWSLNRMIDQPRYEAYRRNDFFDDRRAMRPPPEGTIRFDRPLGPPERTLGRTEAGDFIARIPLDVDRALIDEGETSFARTCAACHGVLGDGNTVPAEHMRAVPPPTLHSDYMRAMPDGQLYASISEGFGLMPSYANMLNERERWGVVAYVRALQLSQHAEIERLPDELRTLLREETP